MSFSKPADYEHFSREKTDKLNSILEEMVTKVAVDFSNPEIQDIQSAVSEMLERIKTRINERGLFSISRVEPCGSMAEKTAMWKSNHRAQPFIEFDFLAVLQAACDFETRCQECCYVETPPINLEKCAKYYGSLYTRSISSHRHTIAGCFIRETNECLASCGCLEVKYQDEELLTYTFKPVSTCSENQPGCDKCTIDTPTGTLRVKTSVEIGGYGERCSLIFVWTSKAKTLSTRDKWRLPQSEKMDTVTIHIDFLPALELFQSNQQSADAAACSSSGLVLNPAGSGYVHYCFLVPKYCVVCDKDRSKDTWRRSGCLAEIDTFVKKMSDKHRKCYKMIKYIHENCLWEDHAINSYHIKIVLLHHNRSCSNASEDCAKCVFKVLDELQHAYKTRQLTSFHSQANLLEQGRSHACNKNSKRISTLKEAMCYAVSESDSVSSFTDNIYKLYGRIFRDKIR